MADTPEIIATEAAQATTEVDAGAPKHLEPTALGLEPYQWVAVAMLVLLAFAFFYAKVHKTIAGGLDGKIAAIKSQLDEAKALRGEAEALREEYAAKIAGAEKDAAAMLDNAKNEAAAIVAKAEEDSAAMIARRERMANEKIAAAERNAVDQLRAEAARASTAAAASIIADRHDANADKRMIDETIANI